MQPSGPPAIDFFKQYRIPAIDRVTGWRAVIDFAPKPTSSERLCAGVVTRTEDGEVQFSCAIDQRKVAYAFGAAGAALCSVAEMLCSSLAQHWETQDISTWIPPFEQASVAQLSRFSARDFGEAHTAILNRTSTLKTLFGAYEIEQATPRAKGIVKRVMAVIQKDTNSRYLSKRFSRELPLGDEVLPLTVDFLGQHYACYFLQVSQSAQSLEINIERALGKLFALQALRKFVKKPRKAMGLLEEERPETFELVMVGDRNNIVQRRAIHQVEVLADRGDVIARALPTAQAAAEHLVHQERMAA